MTAHTLPQKHPDRPKISVTIRAGMNVQAARAWLRAAATVAKHAAESRPAEIGSALESLRHAPRLEAV